MTNNKLLNQLKNRLFDSIKRNHSNELLFSGGLDTSILAILSPNIIGINISLENYSSDIRYAKLAEKFFNLVRDNPTQRDVGCVSNGVNYLTIKTEEAIDSIPEIIKILKNLVMAKQFGLIFHQNECAVTSSV